MLERIIKERQPPVFKYLKRKYAKKMMEIGQIQIGTLSYYRDIEDKLRADRNEGKKNNLTSIKEGMKIENSDEWKQKMKFVENSNITYKSGTVRVEEVTNFIGNEDLDDSYIFCTSKVFGQDIKEKFEAESCIEIFNVQGFLSAIDQQLAAMGLIYGGLSSGRQIDYVGHTVKSDITISGDWLKDEQYKHEEEFRFSFIPIRKRGNEIIQPTIRNENGVRVFDFPRDTPLTLRPVSIRCKAAIKFCKWR